MRPDFESIEPVSDGSIKVFRYNCDRFQNNHGWHCHPEYEVSLVIRGQGERLVGDSIEAFGPGDMVLIGPHLPHCWISADDHLGCEMIVMQFAKGVFPEALMEMPESESLKRLFNTAGRALLFDGSAFAVNLELMTLLLESEGLERYGHALIMFSQLMADCAARPLATEAYALEEGGVLDARLTTVMDYVRENLTDDIRQSHVSELIHMSPQGFSRFFKAQTGRTFVGFVNSLRIAQACRYLIHSSTDITEVAYQCGYASLTHFNRQFSEIKKMSPSQFRKKHTAHIE